MNEIVLRPHQKRFLDQNPDKALLVWEMRTGKSIPAKLWSEHPSRNSNAYIICLKQNKQDWLRLCPNATVYTKEEFKKNYKNIIDPSCIVIDEAHNFAAPLFITKKRSQLVEAMYGLVKAYPKMDVLLLTATPLSNDPASIHTLLTFIGKYINWNNFRDSFYQLEYKPFLPRPAYFPIKDWRGIANELLYKYADIVSLADCINSLPKITHEIIKVKKIPKVYAEDEEYHWTKDHLQEQLLKIDKIKEIGDGFRKIILVVQYTSQIDELAAKLKNHKPIFILDGRTKNADITKKEAQIAEDCYFIVQSKMGFAWDGWMFGCMVFISMAHRVIDFTQMLGRLTSVDHPKPMLYYYLIAEGDSWDNRIYKSVKQGFDFNPHHYDRKL